MDESGDSDMAPMSSLVDLPSEEELKEYEKKKLEKSVKMAAASSASEDELSATEAKKKRNKIANKLPSDAE